MQDGAAIKPTVIPVGANATPIWGMPAEERLRRIAAAQGFLPVFVSPGGIAAAVGFERRFMVLQAVQKRQDRHFIVRQAGGTDAHASGRAP